MLVLAIDTSGSVTSLGFGDQVSPGSSVSEEGGRRHAEVIDTLMANLSLSLGSSTPDAVCVGVGPGPYSGLRVGIAFGVGLGRAWDVPVVGVCSLDARAWSVASGGLADDGDSPTGHGFVVTADARRNEIYWARYDSAAVRVAGPRVLPADRIAVDGIAGDGIAVDGASFHDPEIDTAVVAHRVAGFITAGEAPVAMGNEWVPHGADAASLHVPSGPLLFPRPLYLRAPDITWSAANTGKSS